MSGMDRFYKRQKEKQSTSTTSSAKGGMDRYYEKQYYNSLDTSGVNNDYINAFVSDMNSLVKGYGDYSLSYTDANSRLSDLKSRYDTVSAWLYKNKSNYDNESYSNVSSALREYKNIFDGINNFYSKFEDEEQYNSWYVDNKNLIELESAKDAEDFGEYSQIGTTVSNPNWNDAHAPLDIAGWTPFGEGKKINNMVTFAETNASEALKSSGQALRAGGNSEYGEIVDLINSEMEDEEKLIYNYYVGKGDTEKANEYLRIITDKLRERKAGKLVSQVDNTLLEGAFAYGAGLQSWFTSVGNIDNFIKGTEGDPTTTLQYAYSKMSENNTGVGKVATDLLYNIGNQTPSILAAYLPGGAVLGKVAFGASAVGNAYSEMRNLGYNEWQSRGYATAVGISEVALQSALGGISKLGGKYSLSTGITKLVDHFDHALAKLAIKLPLNMASEALEEGIQTVLDPAFKALMTGEDFESPEWEEVFYSGLLGALSAGFLEGIPAGKNAVGSMKIANEYRNIYGDKAVDLVAENLEIDPNNTHAQRMQAKLDKGKSLSGYNIEHLIESKESALVEQDTAKIKSAALKALGDHGETSDVTPIADVLVKYAKGEELTSKDWGILNDSKAGHIVLAEMNKDNIESGGLANKWAEKIGTRRINPDVYNREAVEKNSVANALAKNEKATEANTEASKDAKITIEKDGTKVEVKPTKITSIENDTMSIELDNGEVVNADEVDFGESGIGLVYQVAKDMAARVSGFNLETANALVMGYNPTSGQTVGEYVDGWNYAFRLGKTGVPSSKLVGVINSGVSERVAFTAYELGKQSAEKAETDLKSLSNNGIINTNKSEVANESGESVHLRNSGKRDGGKNTQRQVSRMEDGTGQAESRGKTARIADSEAARLVNEGREVKVADLGIRGGSNEQTVRLVDKENETISMKEARKKAEARGLKVKFFVGDNLVIKDKNGDWLAANGYIQGKYVFVRADHSLYTADQIMRHELGHDMIAKGEVDIKAVRKRLEKTVGKDNIDDVAEQYEKMYAGSGMSAEEIWEECICDSLGDMNIFESKGQVSASITDILPKIKAAASETKSPTQTRGSPEGKASRDTEDIYTATSAFDREVDAGDHRAFARSLAHQTSGMVDGEIRTIYITSTAKVYAFRADGYMHGEMIKNFSQSEYEKKIEARKEYLNEVNSDRKTADLWLTPISDIGTESRGNISLSEGRGRSASDDLLPENASERNGARDTEREWKNPRTEEETRKIINEVRIMYGLEPVDFSETNFSREFSSTKEAKGTGKASRELDTDSTEYKINTSMTMAEAKRMIETAYKVNNIAEYYEGEYKDAEDWLKKAGSDEVEMYIENDFDLQAKYVNSNEDILNEEYRISDVLDAYLAGTLIGKEKPKPKRLDVSKSTKLEDSRFYSPQKIEDAKATFELAKQKAVGKDAAAINRARAEILLFAHNKGAAELLGITQSELNKKLRSWSNYSATAKNISERINEGVAEENRWTGIENSSYINKAKVTNEDIERLVASVDGDSKGYERKYIARVMLAADTHIDYSGLKFKFASSQQVNEDNKSGGNLGGRVLGFYDDTNRQIEVTHDKPNTVAHEMGHYIDAQWGRELVGSKGSHLFLTRGVNADIVRERYGEPGVQFLNNFKLFINSLSDVNQTYNSYYNDRGEIFARFFARFIEWTDNIATGNKYYSYESTMYGDKFTQAQYVEFARLLQEKALLDGTAKENRQHGKASRELDTERVSYAPTFYSHMGKVIDGIKLEKMGAGGVVSYLKGKGVKDEEIKWSGIEAFLEGKKSVSKAELQEFIAGSQLQIEEEIGASGWTLVKEGENYIVKDADGNILDTWEPTQDPEDSNLVGWINHEAGDIASTVEEIREYTSDWYDDGGARWSQYRLDGGSNYRELVFKMPNSTYTNDAMRAHWGQDAEGVLAHARIQDMTTSDGRKMLFVEEIQSDWHNEGHQKGYAVDSEAAQRKEKLDRLYHTLVSRAKVFRQRAEGEQVKTFDEFAKKINHLAEEIGLNLHVDYEHFGGDPNEDMVYTIWEDGDIDTFENIDEFAMYLQHGVESAERAWTYGEERNSVKAIPDAPFRNTYHEYVLKRLLRMAAEEDYDSIGWTPSEVQMGRWNPNRRTNAQMGLKDAKNPDAVAFEDGYRIEYDQDMPKFLRKYGKKWGATVGKAAIAKETMTGRERILKENELENVKRDIERAKQELARKYDSYEKAVIQRSIDSMEKTVATLEQELSATLSVWSMDIPDSMKESVLYEGQPKYSRELDLADYIEESKPLTNREILANALETAVQHDVEREKLKQYKANIDLINSEQEKLQKLQEQISELYRKKGPRDTEAIKSLQFEANQAANRINTYDKQLLDLESTKALKGVLQREKAMLSKRLLQKAAQSRREALDRARERAAKTERELMNRYQESRKRGIESRNKTAMRHKIKDVVNELNQYLLKGTKDKHIPIELQKPVAEALNAVNMDTVSAEERIAKKRAEMMSAKSPEAIEKLAKEIEHIQEMGGNMEAKLSRLKTAYDSIINSDDPLVANSHDEVISNTIGKVIEDVGETPLRDMSLYQLEAVYDMYRMVLHSIRNANKAFKAQKSEEISVIANRVMEEVDKLGKRKIYQSKTSDAISAFDWNNEKPVYAFERIGSDTFTEVFNNVRAGEDTWAVDMSEAQAFREEQYNKHKYDSWDFDKKYTFTSSTGKSFELTLGQIMSLYAFSKRGKQAKDHLKNGGFVFDGLTEIKQKNKLGVTRTYRLKDATAYNLSEEILTYIISKLKPEQTAFVDAMQDYLTTVMGEKGNEVSLELYGVKLFSKEKHYFPLKSAPQFLERAREQAQGDVKIKNKGFTKETTPKAKNPIVLTSFMDVWAGHVNEMSMYHGFTLALEDFYRVFNYKTPASETMDSEGVISFLENAHGAASVSYIDQLLKDLNGGATSDPRETPAKALMSKFKKASVMASVSVVIQQPSAIVRAQALVDAKYFVGKKVSKGKHKEIWAEVKRYAPVAIIKEMGYFDVGMGRSSVEWLKGEKSFMDKVDDVLSKAPALADEVTWVAIWNAVKRETARKNPTLKTSSEEFLKLAGERFTEVITKTQVYDSTLARSANMRSKSGLMAMWTAFMAEPTTSLNMVADAIRKGNKKYIARTVGAVVGSVILNSALVSLVYAMRDDDEDETFLEKYLSRFTTEVIDGINPLTYIPFVKDIWSVLQGYDIERSDMTLITAMVDALEALIKEASKETSNMDEEELREHNKAINEAILGIMDNIASLTGIPVKNIRRDFNGIVNGVKTIIEDASGRETTAGSLGDVILGDVKESVPVWGWFPDESKADKLYDAIVSGDTAYVDRLKSGYKDEKAYETAVRKALRENDTRIHEAAQARFDGNIAEYKRIAKEIIAEGNFSQDAVVGAINSEMTVIKKSESSGEEETEKEDEATSIYGASDINAAFESGDTSLALEIIDDLVNTKVANGTTETKAKSSVRSSMTSYWKPLYKQAYQSGNYTEMARIRKILYASGLYGSANDVVKTGNSWLED